MTDDDLRALDRLLAEKIMGWERLTKDAWATWSPTTNDAQAMQVAEALQEKDYYVKTEWFPQWYWLIPKPHPTHGCTIEGRTGMPVYKHADTLPLAICLAAKQVCEVEG